LVLVGSSTSTGYEGTLTAGTYSFTGVSESFTKSCASVTGATVVECNGACVNTRSDPLNCGGCGDACAAGQACRLGTCIAMCTASPPTTCGAATMIDTNSNNMHCGFCNNACAAGEVCSAGVCADSACSAGCSAQYDRAACGQPREFSRKGETKVDFTVTKGQLKGTFSTSTTYACKDPGCPSDFSGRCPTCAQTGMITGTEVTNVTEFEPR
ncbi:MAG: hypothetical protein JNK82_22580, partial [Myxococcaceae bacterium]|nr:hypothetical protein [Myxococcaceae bacterium]